MWFDKTKVSVIMTMYIYIDIDVSNKYVYICVCVCTYTCLYSIYYVCLMLSASNYHFKKIKIYMSTSGHLPSNKCNHRSRRLAAKAKGGRSPRTLKERFSSSNEDGNLGSLSGHFWVKKPITLVYRSGYLWIFMSKKLEKSS